MKKAQLTETAVKLINWFTEERSPIVSYKWQYDCGLLLLGFGDMYKETGNREYFDYIKNSMDYFIGSDGTIKSYDESLYNLDHVNNGKNCFWLYEQTGEEKYIKAVQILINQLKNQPRTSNGVFFHKRIYPNQIWLDGIYMSQPFRAEYARMFNLNDMFDDIVHQITTAEAVTYEPRCELYAHAYDDSRQVFWADKQTGRSLNVWGRACGWFCMAIVDVLDFMPKSHLGYKTLIETFERVISRIVKYQDETGTWYQVLDNRRSDNYKEATCSCMFAYSLNKAIKNGYIDENKYRPYLERAVSGLYSEFIRTEGDKAYLDHCCCGAGLGPADVTDRDGTLDYYFNERIISNDCKGSGTFLRLAADYIY